jgi:hypothetical protein
MKQLLIISLFLVLFTAYVAYRSNENTNSLKKPSTVIENTTDSSCSSSPARTEVLLTSTLKEVRNLSAFDQACNSESSKFLVIKTVMPTDDTSAKNLPIQVANTLLELNKYNIKPYVLVNISENTSPEVISELLKNGNQTNLETYFNTLKSLGVTSETIGTWIPYPEANLPTWNNSNLTPESYTYLVNSFITTINKTYPEAKIEVLLSSATYDTKDFSWAEGEYVPLDKYINALNLEKIDSIGISGYPWVAKATVNESTELLDPYEYLSQNIIENIASARSIKKFTLYTGTFASKYGNTPEETIQIPVEIRKTILDRTINLVKLLKSKNYEITVILKSNNETSGVDKTDWSYWGSDWTSNKGHQATIVAFIKSLNSINVPLIIE